MNIVLMEPLGISAETLDKLAETLTRQGHQFTAYDSFTLDTDELIARGADADVMIIANHPLPAAVIEAASHLKLVSVAFVGIDHVDAAACKAKGVKISNTGGYCDDAVAELTVGLTLDCLRNITACHAAVQSGKGKAGLQGHELAGRTVGIVGTGAIGCRVAEVFKVFGCKLIGYNRSQRQAALDLGVEYMPLDELMAQADIVTVHTPLTPETKGLIGAKEIGLMKQDAILINTARGPVVDTQALADALNAGKICAGIDVCENDPPLPADHPLWGEPGAIITPHISWAPKESRQRIMDTAVENVKAYLAGAPINVVNR